MSAQYGIMLFFAAWCFIMTLYIILCLPETKGVPIEEIVVVWRKHWLWKRFVQPAAIDLNGGMPQCSRLIGALLIAHCTICSACYHLCERSPQRYAVHFLVYGLVLERRKDAYLGRIWQDNNPCMWTFMQVCLRQSAGCRCGSRRQAGTQQLCRC